MNQKILEKDQGRGLALLRSREPWNTSLQNIWFLKIQDSHKPCAEQINTLICNSWVTTEPFQTEQLIKYIQ